MTSGSAGAAGAAAAASAGAATSSAFGMMTWTSIMSASLSGFHFGLGRDVAHAHALVQHQLADVDLDVLRNVGRQALDLDLAADELEDAALLLDALRLALDDDRNGDLEHAVHRDAVEVGVQQLVRDRIELVLLHEHRVSPAPASFSEISVLAPDSECRILSSAFGSTAIGVAALLAPSPAAPYTHRRHASRAAGAPRLVLAERVARCCFEYRFHSFLANSLPEVAGLSSSL